MKVTIVKLVNQGSAWMPAYAESKQPIEVEVKNISGLKVSCGRRGIYNAHFYQDGKQIGEVRGSSRYHWYRFYRL